MNEVGPETGLFFGGFFIFFILIWLIMMAVMIAGFVVWVMMLIDVAKRKNWESDSEKTTWILVVALLGYIGALIYYFVIRKPRGKAL